MPFLFVLCFFFHESAKDEASNHTRIDCLFD